MASKSKAALEKAVEMEREGKAFYLKSTEKAQSVLAKGIFETLAKEEDFHIEAIMRIYNDLKDDKPLKEWVVSVGGSGELEQVFRNSLIEKARASEDDLRALQFGLDMEDKSIKYYETLAAETENLFEKRFYLTLSYEERGHYLRIMDSIEYLTDPVGWHYIKQRSMVDGG